MESLPGKPTADDLAKYPWLDPIKDPDLRVEGELFDVLSPRSSLAFNIVTKTVEKTSKGQAPRIVLNLEGSGVRIEDLEQSFRDNAHVMHTLREVLVITKDRKVIRVLP